MIKDRLNIIVENATKDLVNGLDPMIVRNRFLGRKGQLAEVMKELPKLSAEERKSAGVLANQVKSQLEEVINSYSKDSNLIAEYDLTMPVQLPTHGHEHPIQHTISMLYDFFLQLGFKPYLTPEIETELDNFDSLRVAKDHPARDMQDTFWTTNSQVLRTQTTAFQRRALSQFKPPFAVVQAGRVYRAEAEDATHLSTIHMLDGFAVGEDLSFAHLKGVLFEMVKSLFGSDVKIRFRPSFFPFVEPGAELDMQCQHCKGSGCRSCGYKGWLELLGCGMTHPEILESAGLDPSVYHGIAWGMGIERLAMVYYGVTDIREFVKNDPRFLEQLT